MPPLPFEGRDAANMPGHWLLARLGKRVLRPGGRKLTEQMLDEAEVRGADVVELMPGVGKTAAAIVRRGPASYRGVESDEAAAELTAAAIGDAGTVQSGETTSTGLDSESADVVVGETILTMQTDAHKAETLAEAFRILRPGGRYALHELALRPDDLDDSTKTAIRKDLARTVKVNARPLTKSEWAAQLRSAGFEVREASFAPMALLRSSRMIADEGLLGTLRIAGNVLRNPAARKRVLGMRASFNTYQQHLVAIAIVAHKPASSGAAGNDG